MRPRFPILLLAMGLLTRLPGELQIPFENGRWQLPDGIDAPAPEMLKDGVCYTADANVPLGAALKQGVPSSLVDYPLRFTLRGQEGRGALLEPLKPGDTRAPSMILVVCDGERISVSNMPEELDATSVVPIGVMANMSADFEGLERFLGAVGSAVESAEQAGRTPCFIMVCRSETSFGLMVRLLQLLRETGCRSGMVRLDDDFPVFDFKVIRKDPEVRPPVSDGAMHPAERIMLNLHEHGVVKTSRDRVLVDDRAVSDHLAQERERVERLGKVPKLFLRGERNAVFKHSRRVIRIAAQAGVDQVVFAVYRAEDKPPEAAPGAAPHELPVEIPEKDDGAIGDPPVELSVRIDRNGKVSTILGDKVVTTDADPDQRELPFLKMHLRAMVRQAGGDAGRLALTLQVDGNTAQQRVIDVLNLLVGEGIGRVSFEDVADPVGD